MITSTLGLFALSLCAQTPATNAPAVPAAPPPSNWTATVGLGLISLTGNATSVTATANGAAELKTPDWIYRLKVFGTYGLGKPPTNDPTVSSQVLALAGSLQMRLDYRFTPALSVYVLGGAEADHVASVEFRGIAEGGIGYIWIDVKQGELEKVLFRTDLGFRYANESRFQYYPTPTMSLPGVVLYAPKLGVAFRYAFTKDVVFFESAEVLPNVVGDSRVVVNNVSKFTAALVTSLSLAVSFTVNYDSAPAPMKKSTDTALSVGLEYKL
jgi:putative salt-induced outer membrane protein YdiY